MARLKRIYSISEKCFIDVVKSESGYFELEQFARKYDCEEEVFYEIREYPGPVGKFGEFDSAVEEAERLMKLCHD